MTSIPLGCPACDPLLGGVAFLPARIPRTQTKTRYWTDCKRFATVASTVPANGDVNLYGVALVRQTYGHLRRGHILVSNFNNQTNLQGTGTTIVDVARVITTSWISGR